MKIEAMQRLESASGQAWFDSLSPEQQTSYLEQHPGSKFGSKKAAPAKSKVLKLTKQSLKEMSKTKDSALIEQGLKSDLWHARADAARNPNATPEQIKLALDDKSSVVRTSAAENPSATPELLTKAIQDSDWSVRRAALENTSITKDQIRIALHDKDERVKRAAMQVMNFLQEKEGY